MYVLLLALRGFYSVVSLGLRLCQDVLATATRSPCFLRLSHDLQRPLRRLRSGRVGGGSLGQHELS